MTVRQSLPPPCRRDFLGAVGLVGWGLVDGGVEGGVVLDHDEAAFLDDLDGFALAVEDAVDDFAGELIGQRAVCNRDDHSSVCRVIGSSACSATARPQAQRRTHADECEYCGSGL